MSCLLVISISFLCQSCRSTQKIAKFIIKLLIMIVCVSFSGLLGAIHDAPWLQKKAYFNSDADIVISAFLSFLYWVAAQWSTWVIAFQFYSTAEQMKKVDKHFKAKYEKRSNMTDE